MSQKIELNSLMLKSFAKILILENNNHENLEQIDNLANSFGAKCDVIRIDDIFIAGNLLRTNKFDLLIIELDKNQEEERLSNLCRLADNALIIGLSNAKSLSFSISAMRSGIHEIITVPIDYDYFYERLKKMIHEYGKVKKKKIKKQNNNELDFAMIGANEKTNQSSQYPKQNNNALEIKPMWLQERKIIEEAINMFNGNISNAAKALQISPSTIYRKRLSWQAQEQR